MSCKKVILKISQNLQKAPAVLESPETLTQEFACEFCEIFKSTFFIEHLRATASVN